MLTCHRLLALMVHCKITNESGAIRALGVELHVWISTRLTMLNRCIEAMAPDVASP